MMRASRYLLLRKYLSPPSRNFRFMTSGSRRQEKKAREQSSTAIRREDDLVRNISRDYPTTGSVCESASAPDDGGWSLRRKGGINGSSTCATQAEGIAASIPYLEGHSVRGM